MVEEFKSFYKTVGGWEETCLYNTRLDTYGQGCSHDCKYCYAKSLLEFRWLRHPDSPRAADVEKVKRAIRRIPEGQITRVGWMTDCFQPLEKELGVTYEALKEFKKCNREYLIITKSDLIATDKYLEVLDKDLAHIQVTLTTTDDQLAARYENAVRPSDRIKAIEKLQELGYDVAIRLSPFVPWLADPEEFNKIKCDKILIEFLRVNHWIKKRFAEFINDEDYSVKFHWYSHLPFEKKKELADKFKLKEVTVCDFEPEYLEFWKKEYNPNPEDCCNLRHK